MGQDHTEVVMNFIVVPIQHRRPLQSGSRMPILSQVLVSSAKPIPALRISRLTFHVGLEHAKRIVWLGICQKRDSEGQAGPWEPGGRAPRPSHTLPPPPQPLFLP